jgi:hypothetical protein
MILRLRVRSHQLLALKENDIVLVNKAEAYPGVKTNTAAYFAPTKS